MIRSNNFFGSIPYFVLNKTGFVSSSMLLHNLLPTKSDNHLSKSRGKSFKDVFWIKVNSLSNSDDFDSFLESKYVLLEFKMALV